MEILQIEGGRRLEGEILISGAKNAALPLMIASLLTDEELVIENVPDLSDVRQLVEILANHGVDIVTTAHTANLSNISAGSSLHLKSDKVNNLHAPANLVAKMRASFWVIAPLIARFGYAKVALPGGCEIGSRPVDFLLDGLRALGAKINIEDGYVLAEAAKGLTGADYHFPNITVGGTHVMLMAASLAQGETRLYNAACEPEIVNLANLLIKMGANIEGAGTPQIIIKGVKKLHGSQIATIADRIEAGTYAMAVAMAGGKVLLRGADINHLPCVEQILQACGVGINAVPEGILVERLADRLSAVDISTEGYPGFPTDLQAQFMALMTTAIGKSIIKENIFENRYMHVEELKKFGANIEVNAQEAVVTGVDRLHAADVLATDLRASASLIMAGLVADGITTIGNLHHLDRGFAQLEAKLQACGAKITRLNK